MPNLEGYTFKSVGEKSLGLPEAAPQFFPSLHSIDLRKFPDLDMDVGTEVIFVVKGKIESKRMDETSKTASIEVREIGTADFATTKISVKNEADESLEKLKTSRRF